MRLHFIAIFAATSSYAIVAGGRDERIGACVIAGGIVATHFAIRTLDFRFQGMETGVLIVDVIVLAGLLALALFSDRYWPLWITAFHAISVYTHLAAATGVHSVALIYASVAAFWIYPMMAVLVLGTFQFRRRARKALPS